jgi:hypothetical protein
LDTRSKIVSAREALGMFPDGCWVRSYFDPMLASHAARLEELSAGRPVVLVLADPPDPLLPVRSRAELAAGLKVVRAVVIQQAEPEVPRVDYDEAPSDLSRRAALIERVHGRHG